MFCEDFGDHSTEVYFFGCLAVLSCYDGRVAGMVLLTVWIPVAVPLCLERGSQFCEGSQAKCGKGGEIVCNNLKNVPSAF